MLFLLPHSRKFSSLWSRHGGQGCSNSLCLAPSDFRWVKSSFTFTCLNLVASPCLHRWCRSVVQVKYGLLCIEVLVALSLFSPLFRWWKLLLMALEDHVFSSSGQRRWWWRWRCIPSPILLDLPSFFVAMNNTYVVRVLKSFDLFSSSYYSGDLPSATPF